MNFDELRARPGEPVADALARLEKFLHSYRVYNGDRRFLRLSQTPGRGIFLTISAPSTSWTPRFAVELSTSAAVTVGAGLVNARAPTLLGVPIDGLDVKTGKEITVPALTLSGGPGHDLRSWVVLRAAVDLKTGKTDPRNPDAVTVDHVRALPDLADGGSPDDGKGSGLIPLAMVKWANAAEPDRIFQIVMHNLNHYFRPAQEKHPARHYFSAV